ARFAGRNGLAGGASAAGAAVAGRIDSCAYAGAEPDQHGVGRENRTGAERRRKAGDAGEVGEASTGDGLLFAAADQRAPAIECEDFAEARPPSVRRDSRKRGAAP